MKKLIWVLAVFLTLFLVITPSKTFAKILSSDKGGITVAKNEIINDDLFIGAESANVEGVVNGDLYIGSQTATVDGIINGNLHVAAQTLTLNGKVTGNVYVGAQTLTVLKTNIGGSLVVGAATLVTDKDTVIGGALIAGAGTATIDSQIRRSAYVAGGDLNVGDKTVIGKDFYYAAGDGDNAAHISPDAVVKGNTYEQNINKSKETEQIKKEIPALFKGINFAAKMISFLGALIIGLLYIRLRSKHAEGVKNIIETSFWKSLGVGLGIIIAFIPAVILLVVTIVGIPVAGVLTTLFFLGIYFAKIVIAIPLGMFIASKLKIKTSNYVTFAIGLLAIYLLTALFIIGTFVSFVVVWAGLGALTINLLTKET